MHKVADGLELMQMEYQTRALLEICIWKDLGIGGRPIRQLIHKVKGMRYFSL